MGIKRRKKTEVVHSEPRLKSSTLPTRGYEVLGVDLTTEDPGDAVGFLREEDFRGKVVKPVVTYRSGDEAALGEVLRAIDTELAGRARHVMRPSLRAVREGTDSSDSGAASLSMEAAAQEYMRRRPPRGVSKAKVRKLLKDSLGSVKVEPPSRPLPFWVRRWWSENWGPYPGTSSVELGQGVFAVAAKYVGEEGSSNRAGKSRMMGIVPAALVNHLPPHKTLEDLAFGRKGTTVVGLEVVLPGGESLEVERSFGKKSGHRAGDATGKAACNEEVESRLGVVKGDFLFSAYCGQDDLHGLVGSGSAKLADDLARWHGLDAWDEVHERAKRRLASLEEKLSTAEDRTSLADDELKSRKWPTEKSVETARRKFEKALRADERARNAPDEVRRLEADLEAVIEANKARKLASTLPALRREKQDLQVAEREANRRLEAARVEVGRLADEAKRLGRTCEQGFDGTCPVDGGRCTRKGAINENLKEVEAARRRVLASKKRKRSDVTAAKAAVRKARKAASSVERKLARAEAAQEVADRAKGMPKAEEIRKAITKARKLTGTQVPDMEAAREAADARRSDRELFERLKGQRRKARKEVERLTSKMGAHRYLKVLTSREGARSLQLKSAVEDLESATNSLLAELGADFRVEVEFERETKNYVDVCPHCGSGYERSGKGDCPQCGERRPKATRYEPSFAVKDAAGGHPFEEDSGGGKSLVAITVRVALARMLGYRVLFLDEVCGKLDDRNLQAFVEMVTRLPDLGFLQVFVVSHRPQVAEAIRSRIVVERDASAGESRYFLEG